MHDYENEDNGACQNNAEIVSCDNGGSCYKESCILAVGILRDFLNRLDGCPESHMFADIEERTHYLFNVLHVIEREQATPKRKASE